MEFPRRINIDIMEGDYWEFKCRLKDQLGNPIQLYGRTIQATLRLNDGTTIEMHVNEDSQAEDIAHVYLDPEDTVGKVSRTWDLQMTTDGKPRTYIKGWASIIKQVTV